MNNEKLMNQWRNKAMKKGLIPVALVCCNKEGFPEVFSLHDEKLLLQVWKHLSSTDLLSSEYILPDQEN